MTKPESDITSDALPVTTTIREIQSYIETAEKDATLYEEKNFDKRIETIDFIEFPIINQLEDLLQRTPQSTPLLSMKHRVEKIKARLEAIDINLFNKLRENIKAGVYTESGFKNLIGEYVDLNSDDNEDIGYDNLDIFINGLFPLKTIPGQTKELEPEMVYYQKTPARIIFELVEKAHFTKNDIFFDIGSGLGQVAILVNLLTGITTEGIEFEPAFCRYARDCAAELNLSKVSIINADARKADYTEGTVFFMYTPFRGEMLQQVLDVLRQESQTRKIRIITYGPCTAEVALQSWLHFAAPQDDSFYKLGFFSSL